MREDCVLWEVSLPILRRRDEMRNDGFALVSSTDAMEMSPSFDMRNDMFLKCGLSLNKLMGCCLVMGGHLYALIKHF